MTLAMGLAAAGIHVLLVIRAIQIANPPVDQYPPLFSYGVLLLLTGIAGMLVARVVKGYVKAAADDAMERERSEKRAALMQRDMHIAREIQRGLLPAQSPRFAGYDIAGMSRPAEATGGDYYDWQLMPDGRLLVVLADVSGHGLGPAIVMAVCRAYARATAAIITDPQPLMRRLNELLAADLPTGRFITLVVAVLDTNGQVQLLSAGHGPTFHYTAASGAIRRFGGDGLPLGISEAEGYQQPTEFTMGEGDLLVMLTDGFHEWRRASDGEDFGVDRIEQAIVAAAGGEANRILNDLDRSVRAFAIGSEQQDDVTAVVIKRKSHAATRSTGA